MILELSDVETIKETALRQFQERISGQCDHPTGKADFDWFVQILEKIKQLVKTQFPS